MSHARILARLRDQVEVVDLIVRGIEGFSFLHAPQQPLYTRLHLTSDYDPDACRSAEAWFRASVLPGFAHAVAEAFATQKVCGIYCMDTITVHEA